MRKVLCFQVVFVLALVLIVTYLNYGKTETVLAEFGYAPVAKGGSVDTTTRIGQKSGSKCLYVNIKETDRPVYFGVYFESGSLDSVTFKSFDGKLDIHRIPTESPFEFASKKIDDKTYCIYLLFEGKRNKQFKYWERFVVSLE